MNIIHWGNNRGSYVSMPAELYIPTDETLLKIIGQPLTSLIHSVECSFTGTPSGNVFNLLDYIYFIWILDVRIIFLIMTCVTVAKPWQQLRSCGWSLLCKLVSCLPHLHILHGGMEGKDLRREDPNKCIVKDTRRPFILTSVSDDGGSALSWTHVVTFGGFSPYADCPNNY